MQKRNEYADGEVIESGVGYTVSVGKPYIDESGEVDDSYLDVRLPFSPEMSAIDPDELKNKDYLITLERNGEVLAYRELHNGAEDPLWTVGIVIGALEIYVPLDGGQYIGITDYDPDNNPVLEEGDEIRLLMEPVNIKLSPAFRAAVKKAYVATEPEPVEGIEPISIDDLPINIKPIG